MIIIKSKKSLIDYILKLKSQKRTIGFVPTMGALHYGHLSLIDKSLNYSDVTVASIFLNPLQFNNKEDLIKYPKKEKEDIELLEKSGCSLLFMPEVDEIYKEQPEKIYNLGSLETVLEGKYRQGHFQGVARIVDILFSLVMPDFAFFGEKDFQQLAVINRLVEIEKFNIKIIPCPTIRENDGLAMSSRNLRLTEQQRRIAPFIYNLLCQTKEMIKNYPIQEIKDWVMFECSKVDQFKLEYFEIVDSNTFNSLNQPLNQVSARALIAGYLGEIRLIDNISLSH